MRRYSTFAAIVIGSKNIMMKIFEISKTAGVRELDCISYEYELGQEAYITRVITFEQIEEICEVLREFSEKMKEYDVTEYRCCGTTALRNAKNRAAVVNHIKIRTGIDVTVLSNSEVRFHMYMGMHTSKFDIDKYIEKNTAILDIGSGSIQISLFDKGNLYMTQNLDIGTSKITEMFDTVQHNSRDYISVMEEYIEYELGLFQNSYLKDKSIKNVIAVGDEIIYLKKIVPELSIEDTLDKSQIEYIFKKVKRASYQDMAVQYGLTNDEVKAVMPTILIYRRMITEAKTDLIYVVPTNLCDGLVMDYAIQTVKIKMDHDFYQDIVASVKYIGKRYQYDKIHSEFVRQVAVEIFDRTQKYHGLGKRDRLVLEIAAIIHDIGKYVNMRDPGMNGYQLIMSTEIIGISHREREEVANAVRYMTEELPDSAVQDSYFWREEYLKVAKLSAILRLVNSLDRAHRQKFDNISMKRKGKDLIIVVESNQDITLEISLFDKKARYFSEIIGVVPQLRQRRSI
ncbi:MAG: HD domain-containing protein [Lachnospiraceae bacterium]|nr:HD domain-containing protein [Lachnospiraceae bacterium]